MPAVGPDNVTVVVEFCPASQVARLMASADALVHAGDKETFGLVILEAMASGIPVVAVAAGAFSEIVNETWRLMCNTYNPKAVCNALRLERRRGGKRRSSTRKCPWSP